MSAVHDYPGVDCAGRHPVHLKAMLMPKTMINLVVAGEPAPSHTCGLASPYSSRTKKLLESPASASAQRGITAGGAAGTLTAASTSRSVLVAL